MSEEGKTFKDTAKYRANNKYIQNNYKQVKLSMPYTEADALNYFCETHGLKVAGFIRGLIKDAIGYDNMPFKVELIHSDGSTEDVESFENIKKASEEAKKVSDSLKQKGDEETKVHLSLIK